MESSSRGSRSATSSARPQSTCLVRFAGILQDRLPPFAAADPLGVGLPPPLSRRRPGRGTAMPAALLLVALAFLAGLPTTARADGIFVADCAFSHRASPTRSSFTTCRGASHSHEFFGNRWTRRVVDAAVPEAKRRQLPAGRRPLGLLDADPLPARAAAQGECRSRLATRTFSGTEGSCRSLPGCVSWPAGPPRARPQRGVARWTCRDDQGEGAATPPALRAQVRHVANHVPGLLGRSAARRCRPPVAHGLQPRRRDGARAAALPREPPGRRSAATAERRLPGARRERA